jgi:hypothetical protein
MAQRTVAPAFTRRHYVEIADAIEGIARFGDDAGRLGAESVAVGLAALFAEDNPRFDSARFMAACGVGQRVAGMPETYRETPLFASGVR